MSAPIRRCRPTTVAAAATVALAAASVALAAAAVALATAAVALAAATEPSTVSGHVPYAVLRNPDCLYSMQPDPTILPHDLWSMHSIALAATAVAVAALAQYAPALTRYLHDQGLPEKGSPSLQC